MLSPARGHPLESATPLPSGTVMVQRIVYITALQLGLYTIGLLPMFQVYQNASRTPVNGGRTASLPVQAQRPMAFPAFPADR
jgi:hypothetical protein